MELYEQLFALGAAAFTIIFCGALGASAAVAVITLADDLCYKVFGKHLIL